MDSRRVLPLLFVALVLLIPANAQAQAWATPKGEAFLSLSYQYLDAGDHLFSDSVLFGQDFGSNSIDFGRTQSQVLVLDGDIGVTDRLTVNAAVAFVSAKYLEGGPFGPEGLTDDGNWHGDFQNARLGVRYMAFDDGTWVLTPAVSYGFPTTAYATLGAFRPWKTSERASFGSYLGPVFELFRCAESIPSGSLLLCLHGRHGGRISRS